MLAIRQITSAGLRIQHSGFSLLTRKCSSLSAVQTRISKLVTENKIVVFMKGTPEEPMCGFSKAVVQILEIHDVKKEDMSTHNVLEDEDLRQGWSLGGSAGA